MNTKSVTRQLLVILLTQILGITACSPISQSPTSAPMPQNPDSAPIGETQTTSTQPPEPDQPPSSSFEGQILYIEGNATSGNYVIVNRDGSQKEVFLTQNQRSQGTLYRVECSSVATICIIPKPDGLFSFNYSNQEWKLLSDCSFWCYDGFRPTFLISPDGQKVVFSTLPGQYSVTDLRDISNKDYIEAGNENPDEPLANNGSLFLLDDVDPGMLRWGPSSTKVAYKSYDKAANTLGLNILDITTSTKQLATTANSMQENTIFSFSPSWSPDENKIAFNRNGGGIYVSNIDGSDMMLIADFGENPVWSPNGNKILFEQYISEEEMKYFLIDPNGANEIELFQGESHLLSGARWSPDGAELLLFRGNALYTIQSDGTGETMLTKDSEFCERAQWSLDGTGIALTCWSAENPPCSNLGCIYVMNKDGTNRVKVADEVNLIQFFQWIP